MPGRGTPWRGVGKGVGDRIGSEDIKDLSISEADLDSALASKVNSEGHEILDEGSPLAQRGRLDFVGAGVVATDGEEDTTTVTIAGGGGVDFLDTALLREEFVWIDFTGAFLEKYNKGGTASFIAGENQGELIMQTSGAVAGNRSELYTEANFKVDVTTGSNVVDMKQVVKVQDTSNQMVICDMANDPIGDVSTRSDYLSNINDGFGFIFDPTDSANWQIYSEGQDVVTRTVTSVAVSTLNKFKLEAILDVNAGTIDYEIDGVNVGTISTNLPDEDLFIHTGVYNKTTIQQSLRLDAWELQATRI